MSSFLCNSPSLPLLLPRPFLPLPRYQNGAKFPSHTLPFTNNSILRFSICNRFSNNRRILLPPPKSASINGYGISVPNASEKQEEEAEFHVLDKLRRLIFYLQSILPGGSWWSLSDDVEVKDSVEPVTVTRALGRMWSLVARDRWIIISAFSVLVIAALSEICIPHYLTATIFSAERGKISVFWRNVQVLVLLCLTSGICSGLRGYCFGIANMILVKRTRETLYSALLLQDISFFDSETVGDLTSRLGADCQQVSRVIGNDLNLIFRNVLQGGGALIYLLLLSKPLGLCTLAICVTLGTIMLLYGRYQKKAAKLVQDFTASSNDVAQETLSLIRTVRVYGTEKEELGRYERWLGRLANVSLKQSAAYGLWNLGFNFLYHATQVVAVVLGGTFILSGRITAEQLTKFLLYSEWLIYSTWWVGDNLSSLMQSIGASEKVFQLMDLLPSDQFASKGTKLQKLTGRIEFLDVSFCYPSRPTHPQIWQCLYSMRERLVSVQLHPVALENVYCQESLTFSAATLITLKAIQFNVSVLQHLSISVNPNEVIAVVGLSGSGKSTLVNLLLRLYEPTSGQILIDGYPLRELDIVWWRERIGFVGQEPKLFRMDISSNIRYGCTRDIGQEDIEWAAKQAYAHDFILSLPNGYQTLVDDDLLSGGQKQRIAIARAILRDPTVLILDEATSALDAESEHNVKGVLRSVRNDLKMRRTVLIIAHRLSTIQAADRIVVMDGGQIVEMGTHKELVERNGLYARLSSRQADAVA